MAIKVDVKVAISPQFEAYLDTLTNEIITKETADKMGKACVSEMKKAIATGTSPIDGNGAFPAYKNPSRYPGKRKAHSPVNLKLTGEFLDSLTYETSQGDYGYQASIFYKGKKQDVKEQGHAEGANKQPKRPTIPTGKQSFIQAIRFAYANVAREGILKLIKGGS